MKEVFNDIVSNLYKPKFKEIGFKTSSITFRRKIYDFVIIFDVWKSVWNTNDEITFWFEIGVYREDFYEFIFDESGPKNIRSNHCSIKLSSGFVLNKESPQYAYKLNKKNKEKIIEEIENDMDCKIIPFLNSIVSIKDILKFKDLDNIYCDKANLFVGFALSKLNKKDEASKLIEEYLSTSKYPKNWTNRIIKECDILNLNINH